MEIANPLIGGTSKVNRGGRGRPRGKGEGEQKLGYLPPELLLRALRAEGTPPEAGGGAYSSLYRRSTCRGMESELTCRHDVANDYDFVLGRFP